jgi:hypothetical protein
MMITVGTRVTAAPRRMVVKVDRLSRAGARAAAFPMRLATGLLQLDQGRSRRHRRNHEELLPKDFARG